MGDEATNITGVIVDHSLSSRVLTRYIGMTTDEWLGRYGEVTVIALIGENRTRILFELKLEYIELVATSDAVRHDTFDYRASFRDHPGADWLMDRHVKGRLSVKRPELEELGTFRTA
jgi:hypothetical protein